MSVVVQVNGYMQTRARERRQDGRGGWSRQTDYGDDLHRATGQWNRVRRVVDRDGNRYEERIEAADGTVIREVGEPLDEHRGHGAAKRKEPEGGA